MFLYFGQDDTINLFTYAVLRLTPRALSSGTSSWSYLRKGSAPLAATASILNHSSTISEQFYGSRDTSLAGNNGNRAIRPLGHDKWSKGKDGFLVTDIWSMEAGTTVPTTPTVLLNQMGEKMYLCSHQHKNLTVIFLIPVSSMLNGEQDVSAVKQQVLENVSSLHLSVKFTVVYYINKFFNRSGINVFMQSLFPRPIEISNNL